MSDEALIDLSANRASMSSSASIASDLDTSFVIVDPNNKPKEKLPLSQVRNVLCNLRAAV